MSSSPPNFEAKEQLEQLAAALCDGEITTSQAARLERLVMESQQARRHFTEYLLMHGELCWDFAAGGAQEAAVAEPASPARPTAPPPEATGRGRALRRPFPPATRRWMVAAAAAVMVASCLSVAILVRRALTPPVAVARENVARLTGTSDVVWSGGRDVGAGGPVLASGEVLALDEGLAEVTFDSGARVLVAGPCRFQLETDNRGRLESGRLTATVPPEAAGFAVRTPAATVVDRGTEIGVAVEPSGASAVHVFVGRVELLPGGQDGSPSTGREITAGKAFRVAPDRDGTPMIQEIALDESGFVRQIPPSVSRLRGLVAADRHLIHHYTFEGNERQEICQDKQGKLDLGVVAMAGGKGSLDVYEAAPGFDRTSNAACTFRSRPDENRVGAALQSKAVFHPPQAFTVELLLKLERDIGLGEESVAAAVATRANQRDCGFLVAAIDGGRLSCRLREDAPWAATDATLTRGHWYYVAVTFQAESGRTIVSGYLADLDGNQRTLTPFISAGTIDGVPPSSSLGIGMGFDENMENAYPWPGILDEVAIYDTVLPQKKLRQHLDAILGQPSQNGGAPAP